MKNFIQPIGGFFNLDKQDYLINPTSIDFITGRWKELVDEIVVAYLENEKSKIHSIYIRGSVARGTATEGISDVDTFALLKNFDNRWKKLSWQDVFSQSISLQYPFVKEVECVGQSLENLDKAPKTKMVIATQSLCVFGTNIIPSLPKYKIGKELILNSKWLEKDWSKFEAKEQISLADCQDLMKIIIRSGFEQVMVPAQKYTTDLYWCQDAFGEHFPKFRMSMNNALYHFINPINDKNKLIVEFTELVDHILFLWSKSDLKY